MRIYNHLKKIISIIIERTPLKGIKFIIEHYIIHENYYISFNIFIYSFIIFLVDSNFCGNIVITIIEDEFIKVKLTAQPMENKANKALIEFLSKLFKVPKSEIKIIKGETSKEKTILFSNLTEDKKNFIISQLTK